MPIKAETKEDWEALPNFVALNPRLAGMFDDRDRSGLVLTQWTQEDREGNIIRNWGHVPKEFDCSGIKMALDVNNIFPCNPKGESRLNPPPIIKADSIEDLMGKNSKELTGMLPHIRSADILGKMRAFEEAKGKRDRRPILIAEIARRMKEKDVYGVTPVDSQPAMIRDASGKMVPDEIRLL